MVDKETKINHKYQEQVLVDIELDDLKEDIFHKEMQLNEIKTELNNMKKRFERLKIERKNIVKFEGIDKTKYQSIFE